MNRFNTVYLDRIIFYFSALILGVSLFLQYVQGLEPCPLCLMQRICLVVIVLVSGLRLFVPKTRQSALVVILFFALAGVYFAARQVWLMSLPSDQIPACVPGLKVLIQYFPWKELVHALFWGSGDCTEITWTWLGLSLPAWSLVYFLSLTLLGAVLLYKQYYCITRKVHS